MDRLELLAPAGDLEKLKIAVLYGADAVYFGGKMFSLRAGADGFTVPEIREGLDFAHKRGAKCYMTVNIFAHNEDIEPLASYLEEIKGLPIDAFLVSDPGVATLIREIIPQAVLHLSTQANLTNYRAARFWQQFGMERLVLARELSLEEIRKIREMVPPEVELESFVHGSMCISYSGRCLLSSFMAGRDSNRGNCAHPCRWKYVLEEEKRPGEYFPIEEDARGTYIMNSKDLCMVDRIGDLAEAGVRSLKIEGRMKSIFYVATVVSAYRKAIDAWYEGRLDEETADWCFRELSKVSHREFTRGFYYGKADETAQNYRSATYVRDYAFTGLVKSYDPETGVALVEQRNKMVLGDEIEVFGPGADYFTMTLTSMRDAETGEPLTAVPHPQQMLAIPVDHPVGPQYMLRKRTSEK